MSAKLIEYELLRISNGRVESGRVGSKIVKLRVDMRVYRINFLFFNCEYHAIIEIVKCESGRIAKKWSSAGQICGYRSICSQPSDVIDKRSRNPHSTLDFTFNSSSFVQKTIALFQKID